MLKKFFIALVTATLFSAAVPALAADYLGNTKSMKFHFYSCRTIKNPSASHFVPLSSREEAISAGYVSCGVCNP